MRDVLSSPADAGETARQRGWRGGRWRAAAIATAIAMTSAWLLAGCAATAPDWHAMSLEANHLQNRCWARLERGDLPNFSAAVDCATPGIREVYLRHGFPYMDLLDAFRARWRAIAETYDAGAISDAEYRARYAELVARWNTDVQARNALAAQAAPPPARITLPIVCNQVGFQTVCY